MASTFSFTITAVDKVTAVVNGINASVNKMTAPMRAVQRSAGNLKVSLASLANNTGLDKIGRGLWRLGGAATDAARRLGSMVPILGALTGVGIVAGITALGKGFGNAANQIGTTARAIGVSTQALQQWEGAGRLAGMTAGATSNALRSVGQVFEDSVLGRNNQAAQVMQQYGIAVHRLKDGSVDAGRALQDISRVAGGMSNAQLRGNFLDVFGLRDADALLGKGLPELEKKLSRASSMGFVMSPQQLAAGKRLKDQMVELDLATDKFRNTMGTALAPALTRVTELVTGLTERYGDQIGTKIAEYVERLAKWIDETDWGKVAKEAGEFVDKIGGFKTIAIALAAITFAGPIGGALSLAGALARVSAGVLTLASTALPALSTAPIVAPVVATAAAAAAVAAPIVIGGAYLHHQMTETEDGIKQRIADRQARVAELDELIELDPRNAARYSTERAKIQNGIDSYTAKLAQLQANPSSEGTDGAMRYFQKMGWSSQQAAGIVANLHHESNLRPDAVGDKGKAYGVAQWHPDRQAKFAEWAGKDIRQSSLEEQYAFVHHELTAGDEQRAGRLLQTAQSEQQAGDIVSRYYERPKDADGEAAKRSQTAALLASRAMQTHAMTPTASGPQMVAQVDPGGAARGASSGNGKVDVNVNINGAPPGTTTSVSSSGNTAATIGHAGVTEAPL